MSRADGMVDPLDVEEVVPVLAAALRTMGPEGVVDLLNRLPGVRCEPAITKGFLRAAVPGRVWLGPENRITLTDPLVHEHTVGGIVLGRDPLPPGDLPRVMAGLIAAHTRSQGVVDDAAAALSAVRDVCA